ncbi:hypothetical protein D6853_08585 [Butyrivibrio sp. X503]|uniref:hypothetical protein n=1 Tax=Butyrivibrio sp. X503 TaxID=2364878 RepID=UPI000EAA04AB|nr:hypothetical protein [Butyrivibrio sp. X503]RKM55602.1 hypothetical protein D6853_08585 [Butyrivibrio sp. X503]
MKKLSTFAITSALVFILMGCGVTEEDVISSTEDFTVDEETVEAVQEALSDSSEHSGDTGSDMATTGASVTVSKITSMEKDDPTINYKQNQISVLDTKDQILEAMGKPDPQSDPALADHYYSFDDNQIGMQTVDVDKTETPLTITVSEKGVFTSMNISVGTPKDEVVKTYGDDYETFKSEYGIGYKYEFEKFVLYFTFDNDEVVEFYYTNKEAEKIALKQK